VPVVGAAAGAVPDVLSDAGLTFPPGDAAGLAAAIARLLDHPETGHAMAERGRERLMREHTWERVTDAVAAAYALALGR